MLQTLLFILETSKKYSKQNESDLVLEQLDAHWAGGEENTEKPTQLAGG